jgi:hypothetical protein
MSPRAAWPLASSNEIATGVPVRDADTTQTCRSRASAICTAGLAGSASAVRPIGTRLAPPTRRSGAHRQAVRGERFFQDPERSRSQAVEAEQFGLASVRDVRQPADTDRSERPRRWRSDLGKIIVRHVLMFAGRPPVACSKSAAPAFGDTDVGQASDVVLRSGTQDRARSADLAHRRSVPGSGGRERARFDAPMCCQGSTPGVLADQ